MTIKERLFRIKLTVAVYKEKKLSYKNEMVVPTFYKRRSEARAHIKKEIQDRLRHSSFFISPRADFDLVRYTNEASCNTYLRYRILEHHDLQKDTIKTQSHHDKALAEVESIEVNELID